MTTSVEAPSFRNLSTVLPHSLQRQRRLPKRIRCHIDRAPPALTLMRRSEIQAFAHARRRQRNAAIDGQRRDAFKGFLPAMHGQVEGAVVYGHQPAAAQVEMCLN